MAARAARRRGGAGRPLRQVPRLGAVGRAPPADAPADDRRAAVRPGTPSRRTRACASSSTAATGSSTSIRAASAPAISCTAPPRATRTSRARLGVEPFTPEFTAAYLRDQARGRSAPIKSFLLDQRRIAGVGNIYADEALFRAGIHPLRPAGRLTGPQWERLRDAIEEALAAGIEAKGASIDDFRHVDGARGSFQDQFLVHRREGEPCPRCGATIRKIVVGGRGTYVCEHCQPAPRARRREPARAGRYAASRCLSLPARSAASSSSKPPSVSPSITICGNVNIPVRSSSSARPSGSFAKLISS